MKFMTLCTRLESKVMLFSQKSVVGNLEHPPNLRVYNCQLLTEKYIN